VSALGRGDPDRQSRARRAGYDPDVLAGASVIVVGAGALGQNVLLDLGLSGVRELRVVDGDLFEDHNLTRSPLFPRGASATGASKATTVGRELAQLHTDRQPRVRVADRWIEELGLGAFEGVDVIAACVDSIEARAYLAKVAILLGLPIVDGGFSGASIGMTAYPPCDDPTTGPCWLCGGMPTPGVFSCRRFAELAAAAGVIPALQNGAAALGALCAEAVIETLHGKLTKARRISLDIRTGESLVFTPGPGPSCAPWHRRLPEPIISRLGVRASVAAALAEHDQGQGAVLALPDTFVEHAPCPKCHARCEVEAPTHRWRRDPCCEDCGGPWVRRAARSEGPDTFRMIEASHPRAGESLFDLGVQPGDILEIAGRESVVVRVAGDVDALWRDLVPSS